MVVALTALVWACSPDTVETGAVADVTANLDSAGRGGDGGALGGDVVGDAGGDATGGASCSSDAECPSAGPCAAGRCDGGSCTTEAPQGECDGDPCTASSCQTVAGSVACVVVAQLCACDLAGDGSDCGQGRAPLSPCDGAWRCVAQRGGGSACEVDEGAKVTCDTSQDTACVKTRCDDASGTCKPTFAELEGPAPCDDGQACTANDTCAKGTCSGSVQLCPCTLGDDAACVAKLGLDPADKCAGTAVCVGKPGGMTTCELQAGSAVVCPGTGDPCLVASCDPKTGGCVTKPAETGPGKVVPCDDGDPCTGNDLCTKGSCAGAVALCQCSPATVAKDCPAGDGCATVATCVDKVCGFGFAPPPCKTDGDTACLVNACSPGTGGAATCKLTPVEQTKLVCHSGGSCRRVVGASAGTVFCDDGSACTVNDICKGGTCTSLGVCACKVDADCAKAGGKPCVAKATCKDGACAVSGAVATTCPPSGPCQLGACDVKTGQCTSKPGPEGLPCADGTLCINTGTCKGGSCAVVAPLGCSDGDVCTVNTCALATGSFGKQCSYPKRKVAMCTHGSKLPADAAALGARLQAKEHTVLTSGSVHVGKTHGAQRVFVTAALWNTLSGAWKFESGGDLGAVLVTFQAGKPTRYYAWREVVDAKTGKDALWFFRSVGVDPTQSDVAGTAAVDAGAKACAGCHVKSALLSAWPLK